VNGDSLEVGSLRLRGISDDWTRSIDFPGIDTSGAEQLSGWDEDGTAQVFGRRRLFSPQALEYVKGEWDKHGASHTYLASMGPVGHFVSSVARLQDVGDGIERWVGAHELVTPPS
jgi:hypothetical protein